MKNGIKNIRKSIALRAGFRHHIWVCICVDNLSAFPIEMLRTREHFAAVFGAASESILVTKDRAYAVFGAGACIVWEGDPETFRFTYVSQSAEELLGYPVELWISEPVFWAERIVHPEDRKDAIAYCALATGRCKDHDFVYRAVKSDGTVMHLHDVVNVVTNNRRIPIRLRGIMFPVESGTIVQPVFDRVADQSAA